jgi:hypothetical protein
MFGRMMAGRIMAIERQGVNLPCEMPPFIILPSMNNDETIAAEEVEPVSDTPVSTSYDTTECTRGLALWSFARGVRRLMEIPVGWILAASVSPSPRIVPPNNQSTNETDDRHHADQDQSAWPVLPSECKNRAEGTEQGSE